MKKYLILFAAAMLAFSCSDDKETSDTTPGGPSEPEPPVEEAYISLSSAEYTFSKEGGTSPEIEVSSSTDWELIGDDAVFTPSAKAGKDGDKVTFTARANQKAEEYEEVFTFLCDGETATLTLRQLAGDEMTISTQEYSAPVNGGSIYVEVQASGAFEYAVEEKPENGWLTIPAAETQVRAALETTRAELVAAANDTGKAREAKVIFTLGDISIPVTVKQAQNNVLRIEEGAQTAFEVEKPGRQIEFSFEANFKPAVVVAPEASQAWVTASEPTAASTDAGVVDYTVTLTVAANDGEPRNATVTLSDPGDPSLKIELSIAQDGETPLQEGWARIPDAAFRSKLLSLGYIVSADQEECELTDAGKSATSLNLMSAGISDISGIEAFTELTSLILAGNPNITHIDLSKLTKITSLNVMQLNRITYLNIGNATLSAWFSLTSLASSELTLVGTGSFTNTFECNGAMQRIDFSQFTGSFNKITMCGLQNLTGTLDLHNCKSISGKVTLNICPKLEKLILPKDFNPANLSLGGDANPALEVVYE